MTCQHVYVTITRYVEGESHTREVCMVCERVKRPKAQIKVRHTRRGQKNPTALKHGMSNTPEYGAWRNLRHLRLLGTDRKDLVYEIDPRWQESFEAFFADMGPRPDDRMILARYDNSKPYGPENCFWGLRTSAQRDPVNALPYEYEGERYNASSLARRTGISRTTLLHRIHKQGLSVYEAVHGLQQRRAA